MCTFRIIAGTAAAIVETRAGDSGEIICSSRGSRALSRSARRICLSQCDVRARGAPRAADRQTEGSSGAIICSSRRPNARPLARVACSLQPAGRPPPHCPLRHLTLSLGLPAAGPGRTFSLISLKLLALGEMVIEAER